MKIISFILMLMALSQVELWGQNSKADVQHKPDTLKADSLEYKLVVLDPEFESWLVSQPPENYHSLQYYETRNRLYVAEWNRRYTESLRNGGLYETWIDYDPDKEYGLDLNYRLYYFFRYFELTNNVNLLYPDR